MCRLAWLALALALLAGPAQAQLQVGRPVPALDIALVDGTLLKAKQLEGKVVLAVYWATWCPICMAELPHWQRLYDAYKSKGLEIVALSLDDDARDVADFWEVKGHTFPVAMRGDAVKKAWGPVSGTPTLYLIDRKGVVRARQLGALPYEKLEALIRPLL